MMNARQVGIYGPWAGVLASTGVFLGRRLLGIYGRLLWAGVFFVNEFVGIAAVDKVWHLWEKTGVDRRKPH